MQVEQVLETYFMNLDNTYNKLQTLAEYVDDTEDYIKFEIDTQRNRFIEVTRMVTAGTLHRRDVYGSMCIRVGEVAAACN